MTQTTAAISIFLNTWGNYNVNGADGGAWVELPCNLSAAFERVAERTGEDVEDAEFFINDYDTDISGLNISEYSDIDELNDLAGRLNVLDDYDREKLAAIIAVDGGTLRDALDDMDNYTYYSGQTLEDVAEELVDVGFFGDIPAAIACYVDYAAIARDLNCDGYTETENGVIVRG